MNLNKIYFAMQKIPEDFLAALEKSKLNTFFSNCTAAHQNEYLKWIAEAKKTATRENRISKAVQMISQKSLAEAARSKIRR